MNPSTDFQRDKAFFHVLSKVNTQAGQYVFESMFKSSHTIRNEDIWSQTIGYSATELEADNFVTANPTIVAKYVQFSLTEVPGSNGQAYYIDDSGTFIKRWISPVDVPHETTAYPSFGFQAKLYRADNTYIPLTSGVYVFDYYAGIVLFQEGYTPANLGWGTPKITCYVYIGTLGGGISTDELVKVGNDGIADYLSELYFERLSLSHILPIERIDDGTVGPRKLWSSEKVNSELNGVIRQFEIELNFDSSGVIYIADLPPDAVINTVMIDVRTSFNGSVESFVTIGDNVDVDSIVKADDTDLSDIQLYVVKTYVKYVSGSPIYVYFTPAFDITSGYAVILLEYSVLSGILSSSSSSSH